MSDKSIKRRHHEQHKAQAEILAQPVNTSRETPRAMVVTISVVLLILGIYQSVLFYGLAPCPHPDACDFIRTGNELVSFQVPSSFKRAPVICILQGIISKILPIETSDIHAGWLLNAILHPLTVVLFWLVGRRLIGNAAAFLAVIMSVNPWVLLRLTEGIAETPLLFFVLLAFYLLWIRSKWAYLGASLALLTRYDAAGLIAAVFIVELVHCENWRQRWKQVLWASLAILPMVLWLIATKLTWTPGQSHYLKHYSGREQRYGLYFKLIWESAISPLFPGLGREEGVWQTVMRASWFATAAACLAGLIKGFIKKRWEMISILCFLAVYLGAHFGRDSFKVRYYAPLFWIVILLAAVGLQAVWQVINRKNWMPVFAKLALAGLAAIAAVVAIGYLLPLPQWLKDLGPKINSVAYVGMAAVAAIYLIKRFFYRNEVSIVGDLALAALMCFFLLTNQFTLNTRLIGQRDIEYVRLVQWYEQNAQPDEKLATSLPQVMDLLAPRFADNFVSLESIDGQTEAEFALNALEQGVDYVAWDLRLGVFRTNWYYRQQGMDRIIRLSRPESTYVPNAPPSAANPRPYAVARYEYLGQVQGFRRYINIFRLEPLRLR